MKTKNMKTLPIGNSISRSPLRRSLLLIPLALTCFALSPRAGAVSPKPDGGYPNQNTAEGDNALFSLTTASGNTAIGHSALFSNTAGGNTATGAEALYSNTTGNSETATGFAALFSNTVGLYNTATGETALYFNTSGSENTATGIAALVHNTTGSNNTANGGLALLNNTTGGRNIALGGGAGFNLTTGSNNIEIGNAGVAGEANTIRIGTQGTQTATYIADISGTAVTGAAVVVTSSGQLGVAPSSQRFKEAIKPMDKASEAILALQPVTFRYKPELDPKGIPQFGLVAEEVEKVNPDLVVRDAEGKVFTVRYEAVNAMLLNEFLKAHRKMQEQEATITQLKSTVAQQQKDFQAAAAHQQKEIEALTADLQRVSAQIEMSRAAPQMVLNNQ
jgi:endosialidase-like protein